MASVSNLSTPNVRKKLSSASGLGVLSPAPSLLSLRSVIEFMPPDIRRRYKDTAKHGIWPECPLDGNGIAIEVNQRDKYGGSTNSLSARLKRNFTLSNDIVAREYSKFGNSPVVVNASLRPPTRSPLASEAGSSGYQSFSPLRQRKWHKPTAGPSVAYFSSKDGGDVNIKLMAAEMTRL